MSLHLRPPPLSPNSSPAMYPLPNLSDPPAGPPCDPRGPPQTLRWDKHLRDQARKRELIDVRPSDRSTDGDRNISANIPSPKIAERFPIEQSPSNRVLEVGATSPITEPSRVIFWQGKTFMSLCFIAKNITDVQPLEAKKYVPGQSFLTKQHFNIFLIKRCCLAERHSAPSPDPLLRDFFIPRTPHTGGRRG